MLTHYFATWSLEDPVFEPEASDGRLVRIDPNAAVAAVGFDDFLRLESVVDLGYMGPFPIDRQSMTLPMIAGEIQAIYTTDKAVFDQLISDLDGRDGHRFFTFDPATGSRTPYGPSAGDGMPASPPMTLHYFIASDFDLAVEDGQLVAGRAAARYAVSGGTQDADSIATVLSGPNAVSMSVGEVATGLLTGVVDAFYTTDPEAFLRVVAEAGPTASYAYRVYDPVAGTLVSYTPGDDLPRPVEEEPSPLPPEVTLVPDRVGPVIKIEGEAVQSRPGTDFHLAGLGDNGLVVLWMGLATEATTEQINNGIGARVFDLGGVPLGEDMRVDPDIVSRPNAPVAAPLADGGFVAVWYDLAANIMLSGPAIMARLHDPDGTPRGEAFAVNTETATWHDMPSVTGLADGGFVVAWQEGTLRSPTPSVMLRLFDADGTPRGEQDFVDSPSQLLGSLRGGSLLMPEVAAFPDGGFALAYLIDSPEGRRLALQIFDSDGAQVVAESSVNETSSSYLGYGKVHVDVFPDGRFVVVWDGGGPWPTVSEPDGLEVYARIFARDGSQLSSEIIVNSVTYLNQTEPRVTVLSDDRFVVTWNDASRLEFDHFGSIAKAQMFDGDGNRHGSEFAVPAEPDERGGNAPHVVALPDDRFAIMWSEHGRLGEVQFQIFDAEQLVERESIVPVVPDNGDPLHDIDVDQAEAGDGPFRLLAWEGSGLGRLELGEIDGSILAVNGEAQRDAVEDLLAGMGVAVTYLVRESFSEALQAFRTDAAHFLVVPNTAMPEVLPAGLVVLEDMLGDALATLTGKVVDRAGNDLPGTTVNFVASSGEGDKVETDATGRFSLKLSVGDAGHLAASREHGAGDPAMTTASALEALRMAVGLNPSWGPADAMDFIAADFNGDGQVTTADALGILRVAVGLSAEQTPRWVFVPSDADLTQIDRSNTEVETGLPFENIATHTTEITLTGILVGHVQEYA